MNGHILDGLGFFELTRLGGAALSFRSIEGSTKMTKDGSTRLKKSASGLFKRLSMRGAWGGASMESQPSIEGVNEVPLLPASCRP